MLYAGDNGAAHTSPNFRLVVTISSQALVNWYLNSIFMPRDCSSSSREIKPALRRRAILWSRYFEIPREVMPPTAIPKR